MIYLVTNQKQLFENEYYKLLSVEESLEILNSWKSIQYDSETTGRDPHLTDILCIQFGNKKEDIQIVVDTTTIDIKLYKEVLETKVLIGQNLKFDLQFLYNYNIVPLKVYDTMIVEQLLHLGYPHYNPQTGKGISYSLQAIAKRYLNIDLDKEIRGEIIWRGLDTSVIIYAANDVKYLEDIMEKQLEKCKKNNCLLGAKLECDFVPVVSYMEWCGIKLDVNAWKKKMDKDLQNLNEAKEALDNFVINHPKLKKKYTYTDSQGDLFNGFNLDLKCKVLWSSPVQVIKIAKILGFNTSIQDKKTGEDKDTVIEDHLKKQKGIDDEFLRLYLGKGEEGKEDYFPGHQGMAKLVSSFGQGHLNAINPKTGRIHTVYRQLGADTSRMASGSKQINTDLAKLKNLPIKITKKKDKKLKCSYPNMQQLPSDKITRSCFVAEKGNLWVSCDYSAIESRLGADIYEEQAMINEFLHGTGDMHSLVASFCFEEVRGHTAEEIERDFPEFRKRAKPIGFSQQFGGTAYAIQNAMGCSLEEAQRIADAYNNGFKGIAKFKKNSSKSVRENGYILLNPITGHKTYWHDWEKWKAIGASFDQQFWENYRLYHKGTGDEVATKVSEYFKKASKWDRKSLNSVTQGTGTIILKESQVNVFRWVVINGYFGKILLNNLTHDEANWEFPKELKDTFPKLLQNKMEETANKYCKSLPIPAKYSIGDHWIH
jgi:DNA polymerase I-like protein with 3'-5' exonuclease and polymerase domains